MSKVININDLLGVNYVLNGRTKKGFDCYGLAIEVSKRFGHEMPDVEEARKDCINFEECLKKGLTLAKVKEVPYPETEGDVVFLKNFIGIQDHIGIYLGDDQFIHCNGHGVHIEKLSNKKKFIGRCYTWL